MKFLLLLTFWITTLSAQNFSDKHVNKLKTKKDVSYMDLIHENPGCLENSFCSAENGKKILTWNSSKADIKSLKAFKRKYGLPVQFLVKEGESKTLDPILYNSRCEFHNPKASKEKIDKGILFLRNDPKSAAIILPKVKNHDTGMTYSLPYGDQPLFIKNSKVYLTSDFENKDFSMSITESGKWNIELLDPQDISKAIRLKESVDCKKSFKPDAFFAGSYCTKIWNITQNKTNLIEQQWSCP